MKGLDAKKMERNENGFSIPSRIGRGQAAPVTPREGCGRGDMPETVREGCGMGNSTMPGAIREGCGMGGSCGGMNCSNMNGYRRQLAMVYAPMQCFRMLYNHSDALMRGTLFEELDKPLSEGMR